MSIWSDCKQYNATPFFGFPVLCSMSDDKTFKMEFPKGYSPNGNCTHELSDFVCRLFGEEVLSVSGTEICVLVDNEKLAWVLLKCIIAAKMGDL